MVFIIWAGQQSPRPISLRASACKRTNYWINISIMETFELRYFVAVARCENVNKAGKELAVSPGSLSKAIARLEDELGVKLFQRLGRNIRLSDEGRLLLKRASEILRLEEAARVELKGEKVDLQVRIAAPEILLAGVGLRIIDNIQQNYPHASFIFTTASEAETERLVRQNDVHLGITTTDIGAGLTAKKLIETTFKTVVGRGHVLFKSAKAGKTVPVAEVLKFPFVSSAFPILGRTEREQAPDGWRDDKFPRRIGFVASSLQLLEELVISGKALAYIPDYYAEQIPVVTLKISGCPYSCHQTIRLLCRSPEQAGWLNNLF